MPLKILIVDDEPFAREDLRYMLAQQQDIEVIWEAGKIEEARNIQPAIAPTLCFSMFSCAAAAALNCCRIFGPLRPALFLLPPTAIVQRKPLRGARWIFFLSPWPLIVWQIPWRKLSVAAGKPNPAKPELKIEN
jgi:hypothetical protein